MTTPAYNVNTPFNNYFFYKSGPNQGSVLVGGTVDFFSAADHNQRLDTYSDISDPDNPVVNPNPIVLGADGSTGNSTANSPVVYMQQEDYFIVVTSAEGTPQFTVDNYSGAILDPSILIETDPRNFIIDGQFNLGIPQSGIVNGLIDYGGWIFSRDRESGTDSVAFPPFTLGEADVPQTPYAWLHYNCPGAGSGETQKTIYFIFKHVRSFENKTITYSFWAKSAINSTVTIYGEQYFGSGGSSSGALGFGDQDITLTTSSTFYSGTAQVPSCAGKTLGTNGDDYVAFAINLPLNQLSDLYITNVIWQIGNQSTDYEYKSYEQNYAESIQDILASEIEDEDGASGVGYYDSIIPVPAGTTVKAKLDSLQTQLYQHSNLASLGGNSNFWVWTYGSTFTFNTIANFSFADRWLVTNGGSGPGTITASMQPIANTALFQIYANSDFYAAFSYTSGGAGNYFNLSKVIHNVQSFNGQEITVTWGISNSSGSAITLNPVYAQYYGTGGSPSIQNQGPLGAAITIAAGQVGTFSVTAIIPSIVGKTLGSNGDSSLLLILSCEPSFSDLGVSFIGVDIGEYATPYVGKTYTEELLICRNFRISTYPNGAAPGSNTSSNLSSFTSFLTTGSGAPYEIYIGQNFPIQMLATPTVTLYANGTGNTNSIRTYNTNGGTSAYSVSSTINSANTRSTGIYKISATPGGGDDPPLFGYAEYVADVGF